MTLRAVSIFSSAVIGERWSKKDARNIFYARAFLNHSGLIFVFYFVV
jgi:hypothetical protein